MQWEWEPVARLDSSLDSTWIPFPDASSRKIESALCNSAPFELLTDPRPTSSPSGIAIHFGSYDGYQLNLSTNAMRPVRRSAGDPSLPGGSPLCWACDLGTDDWMHYNPTVSNEIEQASSVQGITHLDISLRGVGRRTHRIVFEHFDGLMLDSASNAVFRVRRLNIPLQAVITDDATIQATSTEPLQCSIDDRINSDMCLPDIAEKLEAGQAPQATNNERDRCPICLDDLVPGAADVVYRLKLCGHLFHGTCIVQAMRHIPTCPTCKRAYAMITGNMPTGNMNVSFLRPGECPLAGYTGKGTIVIHYSFRGGRQGPEHPNSGKPYTGTTRVAYLPDNADGQEVLRLLRVAFDRRLTFAIGRSVTTGRENTVVWNGIHHKTNVDGGPAYFGYPDAGYFDRVKAELDAVGVR